MEKKLFLLDAYALIYRAYYALIRAPRYTSDGFNTSAIFGFCNTLDEVLKKENPTHIAVCFDPHGPTFRHEAYDEYKANREKQPEDITKSLPYIKEIIEAKGIRAIEIEGYEADDVIGTLSRRAEKEGFVTYMMTPDKDYGQLVTDKVLMYKPSLRGQDFEIRGPKEIRERYGIQSSVQVIDLLALEGDSIDNIPGCPGIGPKTAQKLIEQYGDVEKLIEHAGELKGAVKDKIVNNTEQILFSKYLATIKTDVPVDINPSDLIRSGQDDKRLRAIYEKLEFRSLINRMGKTQDKDLEPVKSQNETLDPFAGTLFDSNISQGSSSNNFNVIDDVPLKVKKVDDFNFEECLKDCSSRSSVSLIFKSVGENAMEALKVAFCIATDYDRAYFIEYPSALDVEGSEKVDQFLRSLCRQESLCIVTNDVKRIKVLLREVVQEYRCEFFDVSLASYLIDPEARHLIPEIAFNHISYKTLEYDIEPRQRKTFDAVEMSQLCARLPEAACVALRVAPVLKDSLVKNSLLELYNEIELPLASVLAKMEITGVRIDVRELKKLSDMYSAQLREMEEEAFNIAGVRFNIGSPSQVGEVLFSRLGIDPKAKKTKKGSYSTTEENLEKYRKDFPIVELILKIRHLKKLLTTYIDSLPTLVNSVTGKIHTTFNQTVTSTGRLSSTNPNLQNIPVRAEEGREIRRAFVADEGCIFMAADYSQIELRLMADISKDPIMIEAFRNGRDIHQDTASRVFHKSLDEVTPDERRHAKTANFGIIYGISAFGLSERLGIPRSEAKQLINDYMETYPAVNDYIKDIIQKAKEQGYVTTFTGRRRFLPEINSQNAVVRGYGERNAVNAPLQGSAADIIKIAMVGIQRRIDKDNLRSRMIMQVHDELIFNVYPQELVVMQNIVKEEMESAYTGDVRLTVSIGQGENWLEAH